MDESRRNTDQARQTDDERFMREALAEAREAERRGEVPVGAVVVIGGEIAGRGGNAPIHLADPTAHAEMIAIREAAANAGSYRPHRGDPLRDARAVRDVRGSDGGGPDPAAGFRRPRPALRRRPEQVPAGRFRDPEPPGSRGRKVCSPPSAPALLQGFFAGRRGR